MILYATLCFNVNTINTCVSYSFFFYFHIQLYCPSLSCVITKNCLLSCLNLTLRWWKKEQCFLSLAFIYVHFPFFRVFRFQLRHLGHPKHNTTVNSKPLTVLLPSRSPLEVCCCSLIESTLDCPVALCSVKCKLHDFKYS